MTRTVDAQPDLAPLPLPNVELDDNEYGTEYGTIVRLDVVDLAAPGRRLLIPPLKGSPARNGRVWLLSQNFATLSSSQGARKAC